MGGEGEGGAQTHLLLVREVLDPPGSTPSLRGVPVQCASSTLQVATLEGGRAAQLRGRCADPSEGVSLRFCDLSDCSRWPAEGRKLHRWKLRCREVK